MKRHYYHLLLFAAALLLWNCAQVAPLTGGARDTTPPKLTDASPKNASSGFSESIITLSFNEYIQLKDLHNQLIITPSLKTAPEIIADGKKVRIKLKAEELQRNTTYKIFFGRAITDMTEGNANEGFQYVFSTGTYIDSLKIKGNVIDALNNNPVSDAIVVLYPENASDSSVFNSQPEYVGRTTASGHFELNFLPRKPFKIYAIRDKNKNYKYDGESEQIAFLENSFIPEKDSAIKLSLFAESSGKYFIKKTFMPQHGLIHIIYNRKGIFKVSSLTENIRFIEKNPGLTKDTISIYYRSIGSDSLNFITSVVATNKSDTVRALIPKMNPNRRKVMNVSSNISNSVLAYGSPLKLIFSSVPDSNISSGNKIRLYQKTDSALLSVPFAVKYNMPDEVIINAEFKQSMNYIFRCDTAAFTDINGRYNDSLTISFKMQSKQELGKLTLNFSVSKKQSYIIQLLNEQDRVVREVFKSYSLNSSSLAIIDFIDLSAGTYKVRVVFDDNENNKWDSGDVIRKTQPERIFIHSKQIKVLPDWELEEEVKVN